MQRPETRQGCMNDLGRGCPMVSCEHNLILLRLRERKLRTATDDELVEAVVSAVNQEGVVTCELDAVDAAPGAMMTLDEVGRILCVTRERIRQIEERAKAKFYSNAPSSLRDTTHASRAFDVWDIAHPPPTGVEPLREMINRWLKKEGLGDDAQSQRALRGHRGRTTVRKRKKVDA
jgi:hypothetical protein